MRAFACDHCKNLLFFENTTCLRCGHDQGFLPSASPSRLVAGSAAGSALTMLDGTVLRRCANADRVGCNWLVDATDAADAAAPAGGAFCRSCRLTRTRPSDDDAEGLVAWERAEACKRQLVFQLDELGLPIRALADGKDGGLTFDLLSSEIEPVTTGHADGVVTIDMAEGDDAHREAVRARLAEPYRTLLGHFRHETGHYYWEVLANTPAHLPEVRALFGDDTTDYQAAIDRHYAQGPPDGWEESYVSAYATMHPWEDWAETFAHYLHIRDTVQTASAYGVWIGGPDVAVRTSEDAPLAALPTDAPPDIEEVMREWVPLVLALNAINRSMGKEDLYPFALAPHVVRKLGLVHDLINSA